MSTTTTYNVADLPARIASKIVVHDDPDGVWWEWTAERNKDGYGRVRWQGRKAQVHVLIYHLLVDPDHAIWPGSGGGALIVDHVCNNPSCCYPAHLEPRTNRANVSRRGGSSQYVGVCWDKPSRKWQAKINLPGTSARKHLGRYTDEATAAHVYDAACFILVGDFANWAHGRLDRWPNDDEFSTAARHLRRHGVPI